ncbi:MAG: hypothetical protein NTU48_00095 [Legionellales bacterium]|nr:hypothetical protein [Legionellales bacterium]
MSKGFELWYQDFEPEYFRNPQSQMYYITWHKYFEALNFFIAPKEMNEQEADLQNKVIEKQFLQLSVQQQQNLLLISPARARCVLVYQYFEWSGEGECPSPPECVFTLQDLAGFLALPGTTLESAVQNNLLLFKEFLQLTKQEHYNLCYFAANKYLFKRRDIDLRVVLKLSFLQINNLCFLDNSKILAPYGMHQIEALSRGQLTFEYIVNLTELQKISMNFYSAQQIINLEDSTHLTEHQSKCIKATLKYLQDGYLSLQEALSLKVSQYEQLSGYKFRDLVSLWVAAPGTSPEEANAHHKFTFLQATNLPVTPALFIEHSWLMEKKYLTAQEVLKLTNFERSLFFTFSFKHNVSKAIAEPLTDTQDALYQNKITFTQARALQGQALENISCPHVQLLIAPPGTTHDKDAMKMNKISITQALNLTRTQHQLIFEICLWWGGFKRNFLSIQQALELNLNELQFLYLQESRHIRKRIMDTLLASSDVDGVEARKNNRMTFTDFLHLSELQFIYLINFFDLDTVLNIGPSNDYPFELSKVQRTCLKNPVILKLHQDGYLTIRDILALTSADNERYNWNFYRQMTLLSSPSDSDADALYKNKLTFAQVAELPQEVLNNIQFYSHVRSLVAPDGVIDAQEALVLNKLTISRMINLATVEFQVINLAVEKGLIADTLTLEQVLLLPLQQKLNIQMRHHFEKPYSSVKSLEKVWYLANLKLLTTDELFQQERRPNSKIAVLISLNRSYLQYLNLVQLVDKSIPWVLLRAIMMFAYGSKVCDINAEDFDDIELKYVLKEPRFSRFRKFHQKKLQIEEDVSKNESVLRLL